MTMTAKSVTTCALCNWAFFEHKKAPRCEGLLLGTAIGGYSFPAGMKAFNKFVIDSLLAIK
jgi:hypothetical protein